MTNRNELRAKVLQERPLQRKEIKFNGAVIEMIQPRVSWVVNRDLEKTPNVVDYLINFARVPGTDEAIFEEADRDVLAGMPFDSEMMEVVRVINELTGINTEAARKN